MKFRWHMIVILLLLACAPGCSRFRDLTRRDYALLRDPFVSRSGSDDDVTASTESFDNDTTAGRVSIADTATAAAEYGFLREANGIDAASGTSTAGNRLEAIKATGPREAVPAANGPSLSDFIGIQPESSTPTMPAAPKRPDPGTSVAGFGAFAEKRTASMAEHDTPTTVKEDFSDWASLQHKKWNSQARLPAAPAFPGQIQQVSQTVSTTADDQGLPTLPSPNVEEFGGSVANTATPLIRSTKQNIPSPHGNAAINPPIGKGPPFGNSVSRPNTATLSEPQSPPLPDVSPSTMTSSSDLAPKPPTFNSVDNGTSTAGDPFVGFEGSTNGTVDPFAGGATQPRPGTMAPVDSAFQFNTGWKPSNLRRP